MTAMANGEKRSAPSAHSIASGTMPTMVDREVMRIGRKRVDTPSRIAVFRSSPASRRSRMMSTRMIELFTTVPTSSTRPTITGIDTGLSAMNRAAETPARLSGIAIITVTGWTKDRNWAARSR